MEVSPYFEKYKDSESRSDKRHPQSNITRVTMVCRPGIKAAFWHTTQPKNGFFDFTLKTILSPLFSIEQSFRSLLHVLQGDAMSVVAFALPVHRICDASLFGRMLQNRNGQQCDLHSRPSHERCSKRFNGPVANSTPSLLSRLSPSLLSEYHCFHLLPCVRQSSRLTHLSAIRQFFDSCILSRILHFCVCEFDIISYPQILSRYNRLNLV